MVLEQWSGFRRRWKQGRERQTYPELDACSVADIRISRKLYSLSFRHSLQIRFTTFFLELEFFLVGGESFLLVSVKAGMAKLLLNTTGGGIVGIDPDTQQR